MLIDSDNSPDIVEMNNLQMDVTGLLSPAAEESSDTQRNTITPDFFSSIAMENNNTPTGILMVDPINLKLDDNETSPAIGFNMTSKL